MKFIRKQHSLRLFYLIFYMTFTFRECLLRKLKLRNLKERIFELFQVVLMWLKDFISYILGIRGEVKKAIPKPPGAVRCTFEDKILMSGIVFVLI